MTPRGAVALGCQLSGDRELALKGRAGLGQLLDVAFDTVEPLLLGHVSLNRHAGQYHRLSPRCHSLLAPRRRPRLFQNIRRLSVNSLPERARNRRMCTAVRTLAWAFTMHFSRVHHGIENRTSESCVRRAGAHRHDW